MRKLFFILAFWGFSICSSSALAQHSVPPEVEFSNLLSQSGIHLLKGEFQNAISCLNKCLDINPNSSTACFQLSRIYNELQDLPASLNYAKRAYNLSPDNKIYSLLLASLYEFSGKPDLAIQYFEKSLPENPSYSDYWNFYSVCKDLNFSSKQISTLNKMIDIFGYNYNLGLQLALDYESINDLKKAEVEYNKLSCIDSSDLKYLQILKSFYNRHSKFAESQSVQKRIDEFGNNYVSQQLDDSYIYLASGKMDLFYENLIESFRNDMNSTFEDKLSLINTFVNTERFFNLDSISIAYKVLCETYPNNIVSYQSYYSYLMLIDSVDSANEVIKQALEIDKSNFTTWLHLFKVLCMTENYQQLFDYTKDALDYFPEMSDVYLYHAVSNIYLSDLKAADDYFSLAEQLDIKFSPSFIQFNFYRGVYYYFMGNINQAFEYFKYFQNSGLDDYFLQLQYAYFIIDSGINLPLAKSIIKQISNDYNLNYYFYFVRAYYYLKTGDIAKSREDILQAIKMEDSKYYIYNMAGDIFSFSKDCTNAVIYWNQAIDRGGNSTVINQKIKNCN